MARSRHVRLFITAAAGLLCGCATTGPTAVTYGTLHVAEATRDDALDASEAALLSVGYRIDQTDRLAGRITTYPLPVEPGALYGREDSRWRRSRPTRHLAEVRVANAAGGVTVYCKVLIEERYTEEYRILKSDTTRSDLPADAPPVEAGATAEQSAVWRLVGRDRVLEREILTLIEDAMAATPQ